MNTTLLMELIINGSLITAVTTLYTGLIGFWFYIILLFVGIMLTYIKTENVVYPLMFTILGSMAFVTQALLPTQYHNIFYIIATLALAMLLWMVFVKKGQY